MKASRVELMIKTVLSMITFLFLSGCASSAKGPMFSPIVVSDDKALVYLIRPDEFGGSGTKYTIFANEQPVAILRNAGYFPLVVTPKQYDFRAVPSGMRPDDIILPFAIINRMESSALKEKVLLSLSAQANHTYYIYFTAKGVIMKQVSEHVALTELDLRSLRMTEEIKSAPKQ